MQTDFLPEHLPAWMRQPRRAIDWGVLFAAAFGCLIAWSFFPDGGVSAYNGLLNSGFMTEDIAAALGEGHLVPRWSPHAFGGYGAPIPNFIPQGAPYLAAVANRLFTGDTATGLRLTLVAALVWAAVAQYLFCRRWIGAGGALLAAVLYVFSPILGLTLPHLAGDLTGVVGMALLPAVLWMTTRLTDDFSRWDTLLAAIVLAALIYVHPALAAAAAMIAVLLVLPIDLRAGLRVMIAIAGAIGLVAPFWLPAHTETALIHWRMSWRPPAVLPTLTGLFAPVQAVDMTLLNPPPQYTLGTLPAVLALMGILSRQVHGHGVVFAAVLTGAAIISALGAVAEAQVWPLYVTTFCCAALAGLALEWRAWLPDLLRRIALPALLAFVLSAATPVWLSPMPPTTRDFSPLAQIEYEQKTPNVAVLPVGSAVPHTLGPSLPSDNNLIETYRAPPLERIRRGSPLRSVLITSGTHGSTWVVNMTTANTISLLLAYFEGWEATLNGQPLPVERDPQTGLTTVAVPPAADATLHVWMGSTSARVAGWVIAAAALLGLMLYARRQPASLAPPVAFLNLRETRLIGFMLVLAAAAILIFALPDSRFTLRRSGPPTDGRTSIDITTDSLRLHGYRIGAGQLQAGGSIPLTLYWTATDIPQHNYQFRAILIDIHRRQRHTLTLPTISGGLPTRRWLPDHTVADSYALALPYHLQPGLYQLAIEGFDCTLACDLTTPLRFSTQTGSISTMALLPDALIIGRDRLDALE